MLRHAVRFQTTKAVASKQSLNQIINLQFQKSKEQPINKIIQILNTKLSTPNDSSSSSSENSPFFTNDYPTNKHVSELISRSKFDYKSYLKNEYAHKDDIPPTPYELFTKLVSLQLCQPYHYNLLAKYYFDEKNYKELLSFYVNNSKDHNLFETLYKKNRREANEFRDMIIISYLQTCSSVESVNLSILVKFLNGNFHNVEYGTFRSLIEYFYFNKKLDDFSKKKFCELYKQFMDTQTHYGFVQSMPPNKLGMSYLIDLKNYYLPYVYVKNKTPKLSWVMDSMMDHYSYKMFTDLYKEYPNDIYSNRSLLYALGKNTQDVQEVRFKRIQAVWNSFFVQRESPPLNKADYLAMIKSLGELDLENHLDVFFKKDVPDRFKTGEDIDLQIVVFFYTLNYDGRYNFQSLNKLSKKGELEKFQKTVDESLKFLTDNLERLSSSDPVLNNMILVLGMRLAENGKFSKDMESQGQFSKILTTLELTDLQKNLITYDKLLNNKIIDKNSLIIEGSEFNFKKISEYTKNTTFYGNLLRYLPNNYNMPNDYLLDIIENCVIQLCRRNEETLALELFKLNFATFIDLSSFHTKNSKHVTRDIRKLIDAMIHGLSKNLKYCSANNSVHITKILQNMNHFMILYCKSMESVNNRLAEFKDEKRWPTYLNSKSMKQILMAIVDVKYEKLSHSSKQVVQDVISHYKKNIEIYNKTLTQVELAKVENLISKL